MSNINIYIEYLSAIFIRILSTLTGFILTLVISRNLSVDETGLFMLATAIIAVLVGISTLGFRFSLVKFIAAYNDNTPMVNLFFSLGALISLFASFIIAGLIFLFSHQIAVNIFQNELLIPLLKIISFIIPIACIHNLVAFAFQGKGRANLSILFEKMISSLVLILLIIFFLDSFQETAVSALRFSFFSSLFTALIGIFYWFRIQEFALPTSPSQSIIDSFKNSSLILWGSTFTSLVIIWGGQIIAAFYLSAFDIGILAISQRVSSLLILVLVAINMVAAPKFSRAYHNNNNYELRKTSLQSSRLIFFFGIPLFILMFVFGEIILRFFGEEYVEGIFIYRIMLAGQFINVLSGSVGYLLNMTKHEKLMRNIIFISAILLISLSFILIPIYGILGAAIAISATAIIQNIAAYVAVRKTLGINTLNIFKQ